MLRYIRYNCTESELPIYYGVFEGDTLNEISEYLLDDLRQNLEGNDCSITDVYYAVGDILEGLEYIHYTDDGEEIKETISNIEYLEK